MKLICNIIRGSNIESQHIENTIVIDEEGNNIFSTCDDVCSVSRKIISNCFLVSLLILLKLTPINVTDDEIKSSISNISQKKIN